MAKGNLAKEQAEKIIINAFGEKYIGTFDKKIYIWSEENGEPIQIALTMTCPKNPVGAAPASQPVSADGFGLDFDNMPAPQKAAPVEFTKEEEDTINKLIAEFGL